MMDRQRTLAPNLLGSDAVHVFLHHPDFLSTRSVIIQAMDLPDAILRNLLQLRTGDNWPADRENILSYSQAFETMTSQAGMPLSGLWQSTPDMYTAYNTIVPQRQVGDARNTSTFAPHSQHWTPPPRVGPYARREMPSGRAPAGHVYSCHDRRCRNKTYKKSGSFYNHMLIEHGLANFGPAQYLTVRACLFNSSSTGIAMDLVAHDLSHRAAETYDAQDDPSPHKRLSPVTFPAVQQPHAYNTISSTTNQPQIGTGATDRLITQDRLPPKARPIHPTTEWRSSHNGRTSPTSGKSHSQASLLSNQATFLSFFNDD